MNRNYCQHNKNTGNQFVFTYFPSQKIFLCYYFYSFIYIYLFSTFLLVFLFPVLAHETFVFYFSLFFIMSDWKKTGTSATFGFDVQSLYVWASVTNICSFSLKSGDFSILMYSYQACAAFRLLSLQFIVLPAASIFLLHVILTQVGHGLHLSCKTFMTRVCRSDMWPQFTGPSPLLQPPAMVICMLPIPGRWYSTFSTCFLILA